ncbi:MAG: hypothetical protein GX196_03540 [Clostridiaceae bacterium]|nr:hypothetical protein [Clostridiaceae bacterium]
MIVAVQKGLNELKEQLRNMGYDVVTYLEYDHPIDAIVYENIDISQNLFSSNYHSFDGNFGILMVNAKNKTAQEIDAILKKKVYSPLF